LHLLAGFQDRFLHFFFLSFKELVYVVRDHYRGARQLRLIQLYLAELFVTGLTGNLPPQLELFFFKVRIPSHLLPFFILMLVTIAPSVVVLLLATLASLDVGFWLIVPRLLMILLMLVWLIVGRSWLHHAKLQVETERGDLPAFKAFGLFLQDVKLTFAIRGNQTHRLLQTGNGCII